MSLEKSSPESANPVKLIDRMVDKALLNQKDTEAARELRAWLVDAQGKVRAETREKLQAWGTATIAKLDRAVNGVLDGQLDENIVELLDVYIGNEPVSNKGPATHDSGAPLTKSDGELSPPVNEDLFAMVAMSNMPPQEITKRFSYSAQNLNTKAYRDRISAAIEVIRAKGHAETANQLQKALVNPTSIKDIIITQRTIGTDTDGSFGKNSLVALEQFSTNLQDTGNATERPWISQQGDLKASVAATVKVVPDPKYPDDKSKQRVLITAGNEWGYDQERNLMILNRDMMFPLMFQWGRVVETLPNGLIVKYRVNMRDHAKAKEYVEKWNASLEELDRRYKKS